MLIIPLQFSSFSYNDQTLPESIQFIDLLSVITWEFNEWTYDDPAWIIQVYQWRHPLIQHQHGDSYARHKNTVVKMFQLPIRSTTPAHATLNRNSRCLVTVKLLAAFIFSNYVTVWPKFGFVCVMALSVEGDATHESSLEKWMVR